MRAAVDRIDCGTVFRMWADGRSYEIMPNEQAPDVFADVNDPYDIRIDSILSWFTVTNGMTGQYGYNGPIMHDSEFISQGMMDDILEQYDNRSHYFVWTPVYYDEDCNEADGWVILARSMTE